MRKMNFSIRDYCPDDFKPVSMFWVETGLGGNFRRDTPKIMSKTLELGGKLFIAESNHSQEIIGTVWLTVDGRRIYFHHLGVKSEYRRKGIAKALMKKSLRFAREKALQIKLGVHQNHLPAIELYKLFGFKRLGDYDIYIIRDLAE